MLKNNMPNEKNAYLIELIEQNSYLTAGDHDFLISKIDELSPLDRLKLERSLKAGKPPELLEQLRILQIQFTKAETPKKPDILTKIVQVINPPRPKKVLSHSILNQPSYLGSSVPRSHKVESQALAALSQFTHLNQLGLLSPLHVTFAPQDPVDQTLFTFFEKLDDAFHDVQQIDMKRAYFMNFLQSPLYIAYTDSGLTALRHPEITPAAIIFNRLQQINPKYLNTKQFQIASQICSHIRMLASI
jgi:hypothetical protein